MPLIFWGNMHDCDLNSKLNKKEPNIIKYLLNIHVIVVLHSAWRWWRPPGVERELDVPLADIRG